MFGGLGYLNKLGASGGLVFSPGQLFSGGEQGAWYDPSDFPPNWRVNLLTYTEQFDNAAWVKLNTTVGANAVTAPDGTLTADRAINNTTSGRHTLTNTATGAALGITYTASVYVKKETQRYIVFGDAGDSVWRLITFDFDTATITGQTNVTSSSVTSVGDGWFRLVFTATRTAAAGNYDIFVGFTSTSTNSSPPTYVGSTDDKFYVWGAQLQLGSTATAYQQIVTPEISFLQYQSQPVMFTDSLASIPVTAVEQGVGAILDKRNGVPSTARYNLVSFSEQFNNALWVLLNAAIVADSTTAPNGTTTADTFNVTSASNVRKYVEQGIVPSGATTFSVYVKAGTQNFVQLYANADAQAFVNFDVSAGTVGTAGTKTTGSITSVGDGWYRCVASFDATTVYTAGTFRVAMVGSASATFAATTTVTGTFFLWGAQLQSGSSATTYQPTTAYPTSWPSGNHAYQTTSASRPTLRARYNLLTYSEDFSNAAWAKDAVTVSGQTITASAGAGFHYISRADAALTGSVTVTWEVKRDNNDWLFFTINDSSINYFNISTGTFGATNPDGLTAVALEDGWYRVTGVRSLSAVQADCGLGLASGNGGGNFTAAGTEKVLVRKVDCRRTIDAISGIPSYQKVEAATVYDTVGFPVYLAFDGTDDSLLTANVDFATVTSDGQARRNLLSVPTLFNDTTGWAVVRAAIAVSTAVSPPAGISNLYKLTEDSTASNTHWFLSAADTTVVNATRYVSSIYARAAERSWIQLQEGQGVTAGAYFDLANGTIGTISGTGSPTAAIENIGSGWYRCSVSWVALGTAARVRVFLATGDGGAVYTGNGTSGVYLSAAQLEIGSTATAFQNIGTDKMTVWSGLSKLSDAAIGAVVELSATSGGANNGSFMLSSAGQASAGAKYGSTLRGTSLIYSDTPASYASPISNVITLQSDIDLATAALEQTMRINASNVTLTTVGANAGVGNFGTYPLFIGRRNNANFPFNGRIYSLIVRGAASNSSQVAQTERYVASKTPLGVVP